MMKSREQVGWAWPIGAATIHWTKRLCTTLAWIIAGLPVCSQAEPVLTHTDVFVSGEGGYFAYRIPAVETAADGSLLAFAEARKHNLNDPGFGEQDIDLVTPATHTGIPCPGAFASERSSRRGM